MAALSAPSGAACQSVTVNCCGADFYSGRDHSLRKAWILDRLRHLAGLFGAPVCGYAIRKYVVLLDWTGREVHRVARSNRGVPAQATSRSAPECFRFVEQRLLCAASAARLQELWDANRRARHLRLASPQNRLQRVDVWVQEAGMSGFTEGYKSAGNLVKFSRRFLIHSGR